ncbi:Ig-like domain-containing protein, partial [bacterium]|nr:Ig-like domain-containing protein [bacterium]
MTSKTAILKITVRDDKGNPIGGKIVTISATDDCTLMRPETVTDCDGVTTATIHCDKVGEKEITVTSPEDDVTIGKVTVNFEPSEPYSVTITESPEPLVADGKSEATISVLVKDIYGNLIPDEKLDLSVSLGNVVSPGIYDPEQDVYKSTYTTTDQEGIETLTAKTSNGKSDTVSFPLKKLIVTATGSPAKAGKTIEVKLVGVAKGTATFSIAGVEKATDVPMSEVEPGVYTGKYVVQEGDNVVDAVVKVTLVDQYDNVSTDDSQRVTLDTTPPPAPENLSVEGGKIDIKNVKKVKVTGDATPNSEVNIILSDGEEEVATNVRADSTGKFVGILDASKLKDGDILVEAFEEPDAAGNEGIKANISVPKDTSTFILTAHPTEAALEARTGQFVVYQIILEGQNNFNQKIELSINGLPDGLNAELTPEISLSSQEPKQTTQLTIRASESSPLGKHQFAIIASPEEGDSQEVHLTVEVKPPTITKTELLPNYPNPFNPKTWIP